MHFPSISALVPFYSQFFYDKATQNLYYFHNASGAPPSDLVFIATHLKTLFQIEGSARNYTKGITLRGLTLTAAAYTCALKRERKRERERERDIKKLKVHGERRGKKNIQLCIEFL